MEILKLILAHPRWSSRKISIGLPKIEGKPLVGNHGVQNVLERLGLNTSEKRKEFVEKVKGLSAKKALKVVRGEVRVEREISRPVLVGKELTPQQRLEMIERVVKYGESVSKACIDFHISRPNFYKWLNRYQAAPEDKKLQALQDKTPKVKRYYRQTPEKYEEAVLSVVAQYPEFGVERIVQVLPEIAGKPIVGHHGVQNVLRRHGLNTYEKRLAYAQAQVTPVTRLISVAEKLSAQFIILPAEIRARLIRFAGVILLTAFSTTIVLGFFGYIAVIGAGVPVTARMGLFFATIALGVGSIFFAYSMKYYLTLAIVLSFSRQPLEEGGGYTMSLNGRLNNNQKSGNGGWLQRIFGLGNGNGRNGEERGAPPAGGLQPSLDHIQLKRLPFVSIHLPLYNEKKVAERILKACTAMDYPNFEIIVCDDSTDETIEIVQRYAKKHNKAHPHGPRIKILHRPTRQGFKGGALAYALEQMNPKTEFCVVFDADFIPYPDTLELFIKYFKVNNNGSEDYTKNDVAAVGGYQWHVLNKSENWITRGVRTEYAGSYVIERPGREILGLLKQVSGAVYMIRADLLKKTGWGTSITEDFQLTLKLYEQGYRVVYTPYVQAPAECVSTLKRLIRQRMRWAEGHSNNIRKMFLRLILSPKLTLMEKLELLYISPYYLQAAFFLVGTFCWLMAETVFRARLPFWTSLWGWSLVLTNFFSLPLMNTVGLFLEESEEKDYLGLLSFIALSYILVPFQAYASVKGFLEKEEGPWFRTPKTGKITDIFTRGRFYRFISGILPGRQPSPVAASIAGKPAPAYAWEQNTYVSRRTANNQFNNFQIKPKRLRWVSKAALAVLLVISVSLYHLSFNVSQVQAAMNQSTQYPAATTSSILSPSQLLTESLGADCTDGTDCPEVKGKSVGYLQWIPGSINNSGTGTPGTPNDQGWLFDGSAVGVGISAGTWDIKICTIGTDGDDDAIGYLRTLIWKVTVSGNTITSSTLILDYEDTGTDIWDTTTTYHNFTTGSAPQVTFDAEDHLYVEFWVNNQGGNDATDESHLKITGGESCGAGNDTMIISPGVTVPEFALVFLFLVPFVPGLMKRFKFKLAFRQ